MSRRKIPADKYPSVMKNQSLHPKDHFHSHELFYIIEFAISAYEAGYRMRDSINERSIIRRAMKWWNKLIHFEEVSKDADG